MLSKVTIKTIVKPGDKPKTIVIGVDTVHARAIAGKFLEIARHLEWLKNMEGENDAKK